jgi:hypothetical protein
MIMIEKAAADLNCNTSVKAVFTSAKFIAKNATLKMNVDLLALVPWVVKHTQGAKIQSLSMPLGA